MRAKSGLLAIVFLALLMGACTDDGVDATITIDNDSLVDLIELNVAPTGTIDWGPDLFGGTDLFPGETITIGVTCDFYDIRIIDEFLAECIVDALDLCLNDVVLFANADCGL